MAKTGAAIFDAGGNFFNRITYLLAVMQLIFFHHKQTAMLQRLSGAAFLLFSFLLRTEAQTIWTGPTITFTKAASTPATDPAGQDRITPTTWITRGATQGIFNIAAGAETSYSHNSSPSNTEWATGALANATSLSYQPWETWAGGQHNIPSIVGKTAVMHLIAENIYIGVTFLSWGLGSGSFSYQRTTASTPVPVKLASFTAAKTGNTVSLSWTTATEQKTSSFTLERSANGRTFESIGTVAAAGNSNAERQYSFIDAKPLPANFYRLRTNDNDGASSYSFILAVKMARAQKLEIFPNPASNFLHLQSKIDGDAKAEIIDAMGRVVKSVSLPQGEQALTIEVGNLKPGTYVLKAGTESRTFIKK